MDAEEGRWEQRLHTQVGAGSSEVLEPSPQEAFLGPRLLGTISTNLQLGLFSSGRSSSQADWAAWLPRP